MNDGTTHSEECWSWGPKHYECACNKIKKLQVENAELRDEKSGLRYLLKEAIASLDTMMKEEK